MSGRTCTRGISMFLGERDAQQLRTVLLVRRAWGAWLDAFVWHHFLTLTFRTPTTRDAAIRDFRSFRRRLEQRAQQKVYSFRVLERGAAGLIHVHALLAGTENLDAASAAGAWDRGRSDVSVYDRGRGASYYVTKSLASEDIDYGLDHPPRPH